MSGLETDAVYPYTSGSAGVTGTCVSSASKMVIRLTGYTKVTGESAMASYVLGTGPLSICVAASTWSSYTGGIMSSCGTSINHCVQAVGLNMTTSTQYWIVSIFELFFQLIGLNMLHVRRFAISGALPGVLKALFG
jgi:Papain family cysteine protease